MYNLLQAACSQLDYTYQQHNLLFRHQSQRPHTGRWQIQSSGDGQQIGGYLQRTAELLAVNLANLNLYTGSSRAMGSVFC